MAAPASSEFVQRSARRDLDGRRTAPSGARGPCRPRRTGSPRLCTSGRETPRHRVACRGFREDVTCRT